MPLDHDEDEYLRLLDERIAAEGLYPLQAGGGSPLPATGSPAGV